MGRVVYMNSQYELSEALEKVMKKILPIPTTPKIYRGPPPPRPAPWFPTGGIDNPKTVEKLELWAPTLKLLDNQRGKILDKLSARGWCYLLEGLGYITKGQFDGCARAINNCRKLGFLPIDFVAQDQDPTRRFACLHEALGVAAPLQGLKTTVEDVLERLPHLTTDYWKDEEYYLMMCVEKIDIYNLFRPICRLFNVPIMNSRGWYTITPRYNIINLCKEAEKRNLEPVLLLFYDHDITGLKISDSTEKNLNDLQGATDWDASSLTIERFGLNKTDIDKYNLTWIDNLISASGKPPNRKRKDVREYIRKFGERKCEANALLKNEETLKVGQKLCIDAIIKYYGDDALDRFKEKREKAKAKLKEVYDNPIWKKFEESLDNLLKKHANPPEIVYEELTAEEALDVTIDNKYYGKCPNCYRQFDYDKTYIGRLVRCRDCKTLMRLNKAESWILG